MGWREAWEQQFAARGVENVRVRVAVAHLAALDMPFADRLALARELLKGTGFDDALSDAITPARTLALATAEVKR